MWADMPKGKGPWDWRLAQNLIDSSIFGEGSPGFSSLTLHGEDRCKYLLGVCQGHARSVIPDIPVILYIGVL